MTMRSSPEALGSTEIAGNWEHFAVGAALSGITAVCGENVCGIDPGLELDKKKMIKKSPRWTGDRRLPQYHKATAKSSSNERRGHAPRRGRVHHRQAWVKTID